MKNNIPGFDDPSAPAQNEWIKLADYTCVEILPGQTAKTYNEEHAENYMNQDNTYKIEMYFESWRQFTKPPFDIKEGDYVAFHQGTSLFFYRIVRTMIVQMFSKCCVVQLMLDVTQPREAQYLLECGILRPIKEKEIIGGVVQEDDNE